VLQAIARAGQPLPKLVSEVTLFPQVLINVRLAPGQDWKANRRLQDAQAAVAHELGQNGRILIRPSGTEPVVRVMVEAREAALAQSCAQRLADTLRP